MTAGNQPTTLARVLAAPQPADLWELRASLLAAGVAPDAAVLAVVGGMHAYLTALQANLTAKGYAELASKLDITAVGAVALQALLTAEDRSSPSFFARLLLGVAGEGLMVAASRQYVKGQAAEVTGIQRAAAWQLYDLWWQASCDMQPDLAPDERRRLLDNLFGPILAADHEQMQSCVMVGRLYQLLLLLRTTGVEMGDRGGS